MVEFNSIKHELKRNLKYQSMTNFHSEFFSLCNQKKTNYNNFYFSENFTSFPYEFKRNFSIPFKKINNSNQSSFIISKNLSFLKFIQNNPHKGILAKILIDKMKKENNFSFSNKTKNNNFFNKTPKVGFYLFNQKRTIYSNYRKNIILKKININKFEDNSLKDVEVKNNIYDYFKNDYIKEKIKKSISVDFIK